MKKSVLFIPFVVLIVISVILIYGKTNISNSETYEDNKQISDLLNGYSTEYDHEFKFATKKIEQILYGKWQVGDTVGYSLKYDITGGALDNGTIELSKTHYIKSTLSGSMYEYKNPIFVFYNETLEQMEKVRYACQLFGNRRNKTYY